jgi:uncharacterized protein YfaS (alpha-2-macroglobulin family)
MRLSPSSLRLPLILAAALLAAPSCRDRVDTAEPLVTGGTSTRPKKEVRLVTEPAFVGFRVRLSEGDPALAGEEKVARAVATTTPLDAARTGELLRRLPALADDEADRKEFARRPGSQPPPRAGATVPTAFPPPAAPEPPATEQGPLSVVRWAPDGDVPIAPHLTASFSQPMVAVTSQDEAAAEVPLTVTPSVPGQWRWLGTKTVIFEPTSRFPMATTYTVVAPAGTTSATGGELAAAHTFTFRTPPVRLIQSHPAYGPTGLQPVLYLGFDQAIDRDALQGSIQLTAGGKVWPVRAATAEEIEADPAVRSLSSGAPPDRWIAVVPAQPLPKATACDVALRKGAPSAEGPRLTETDQGFSFSTYGPLTVTQSGCSWGGRCPPQSPWWIQFSNPLDPDTFDPAAWTVRSDVRALNVTMSGNQVGIQSVKKGRTTYTVRVPGGTKDVFGQTLGADRELTFTVGPAETMMAGPGRDFLVLDPASPPTLPLYTINHTLAKLRVFAADSGDWQAFGEWMRQRGDRRQGPPPLEKLATTTVPIEAVADDLVETAVDLSPWLPQDGSVLLWFEPPTQPANVWQRTDVFVWVQRTQLGLAAFTDSTELLGWATDLQTGAPAPGVSLSIFDSGDERATPAVTTDAGGIARMPLPKSGVGAQLLVARRDGREVGFLPQQLGWWSRYPGWVRSEPSDELRWYVVDDRGLYRPGEDVAVKGFVRRLNPRKGGDLGAADTTRMSWRLKGPRWNDLAQGEAPVDAFGGFSVQLTLPPDVNLGTAHLELTAVDGTVSGRRSHSHPLTLAEFRRPEFEVSATADPGPYVLGEHALVEVAASYFAGGALPEAETTWSTRTAPASYAPPGWDGWSFGVWMPWWRMWDMPSGPSWQDWQSLSGTTDGLGTHRLRLDFEAMNPPRPWSVLAEATVMDVNRQAWTAKASLLVHPAALYPALRLDQGFVDEGEELTVAVAAVDIEGAGAAGRTVAVTAERMEWTQLRGRWEETPTDAQTCTATSTADPEEPARCAFTPAVGGSWRVVARTLDEDGRPAETELRFWVRGGKGKPNRELTEEELTLVPDKQEYAVGDVARILVQAPFAPWEGLATYQRSGIVQAVRFSAEGPTHVLEIPMLEGYLPGLVVQVDATGQAERLDDQGKPAVGKPRRPAFATGQVKLSVPPILRALDVSVAPQDPDLPPGGSTVLDLTVQGADGQGVAGAALAVIVVDESVLSLTGYQLPDPLTMFYEARPGGVAAAKLHNSVLLSDLAILADASGGPGAAPLQVGGAMEGAMAPPPSPSAMPKTRARAESREMSTMAMDGDADFAMEEPPEPDMAPNDGAGDPTVQLRTNFSAMALFAPAVVTDPDGSAAVPLTLPDSLTRYRIMVVAVDADQRFGKGEATVTARKPVMVRPSPPRFLNFGDVFELPFVIQNQTRQPMDVEVAVRTSNLPLRGGAFANGSAVKVTVPAEDRAEVRFPAAADAAGTARFQVLAVAGKGKSEVSDAAEQELPVWTPATSEAFATYGVIDDGAIVQPVRTPGEVWSQFGGLEITTSSTALQALTDAVIYLATYRYECAEQLSSRMMGIAALRDVLAAFEADELPSPEELEAIVARDLAALEKRQNPDGGFGFWRRGQQSWPWVSIHVAHALARAEGKGYAIPSPMRQRSLAYLREIDRHIPTWYSTESRRAVVAYAVFVRELLDDSPHERARRLVREAGIEGLSMESLGLLMPVLAAAGDADDVARIERHLLNRVGETAGAAHFVESYSDGAHVLMHSDRRSDGVILEALVRTTPNSDLIPKVVQGLLGHRTAGRWLNTQENVFVLLALDRYFNTFEKTTPDFVARVWLGQQFEGEHAFRGRTTERALTTVAMDELTAGEQPLTLQKDGAGRLYYRIGMRYAPKSLRLEPADRGFAVERRYESVDDPADVQRDADGTWRIAAGARVRVKLTMVATGRRVHVALVDPLPAGLEPVNPELATSGSAPPGDGGLSDDPGSRGGYWWWWRPWYEHENLRDERVEAFTNLLWEGVHSYTYIARATTPGTFVVPPTKAEEMYNPETFGRSGTDRVIVK